MRRRAALLTLLAALLAALWAAPLVGCATDIPIEIDILLPVDPATGEGVLPPEVASHELRIVRLRGEEGCPGVETSAAAMEPEREFVHAQQFDAAEGRGEAVGALPAARYAVSVLSRGEGCQVWLFGCTEVDLGEAEGRVEVRLRELGGSPEGCGACRSCEGAVCAPDGAVCR